MFDITTTATLRPRVFERTLISFMNKVFTDQSQFRLIINIDPIGEKRIKPGKILQIARKYFDNIVYNFAEKPCFSSAVIWCWSKTESKYVFHLEDDWDCLVSVKLKRMCEILDQNPKLASLKLPKHHVYLRSFQLAVERGFICEHKLSLNPNLLRGIFIREVVKLMDPNKNPEKQLKKSSKTERGRFMMNWRFGIYVGDGHKQIYVRDTGRLWMNQHTKFRKNHGFTLWERV